VEIVSASALETGGWKAKRFLDLRTRA